LHQVVEHVPWNGHVSNLEEIAHEHRTVRREHTFRVKLHSFDRQ
jgi:hypothetical protein